MTVTKQNTAKAFLFDTAWGWCAAWASQSGVSRFQLPVHELRRARELMRESHDAPAEIAEFGRDATPEEIAAATGCRTAGKVVEQVRGYFDGKRRSFDLPIDWSRGTEFQREAWSTLSKVPFGETVCYGELAGRMGRPRAARAMGRAMATNPVPLIVPCHRVVGADGSMCGFSADGGVPIKQKLLRFEKDGLRD